MGGVLPALIWLWFWLKEDRLHPEPKIRLMVVFLVGMASVLVVLPLEKLAYEFMLGSLSLITVITWASIEEIAKFSAAFVSALRGKDMDEPIDAIIYMITAALGFSALENALFLSNLIDVGSFSQSIITGNSRFIGATLLHVASSAFIGVMLGLSYYKKPIIKKIFLFTGICASIILHTLFNLLIIRLKDDIFLVFAGVWVLIVLLIVLIEKVKQTHS
jgi:RsiW-degrading membrane proteinase PrsW (M82 family)